MEHLSLVNSMLAAIGAPPHFARKNIPLLPSYLSSKVLKYYLKATSQIFNQGLDGYSSFELTPCDLPITFEPFSLQTVAIPVWKVPPFIT